MNGKSTGNKQYQNAIMNVQKKWEKIIRERTVAALMESQERFAQEHKDDSNPELLAYVKQCAKELHHVPAQEEVIGGGFIASRFGSWQNVCAAAGLDMPSRTPALGDRKIYREEQKRQRTLFEMERSERKAAKRARHMQQRQPAASDADAAVDSTTENSNKSAQKTKSDKKIQEQTEHLERKKRDMVWGEEHQNDTDEQLLEYIRQEAARLGRTPFVKDVLGGKYLAARFVNWSLALKLAELELPECVKPPKQGDLEKYKKQRQIRENILQKKE